jgi:hypothetical protein
MRLGHCPEYVEKQPDSCFYSEPMLVAEAIDAIALNVLKNEVGLSSLRYSRIDQFRDVRMNEKGKYSALTLESFLAALPHKRNVQELNSHSPLKAAVVSCCQPNAAHSALADLRYQGVHTNLLSGQAGFFRQSGGTRFEKTFLRKRAAVLKQDFELFRQARIVGTQRRQPRSSFFIRHGERFVQIRTEG